MSENITISSILENPKNLEEFLINNGYTIEDYPDKSYSAKFFKIDDTALLAFCKITDKDKIPEIRNYFLNEQGLTYCCIFYKNSISFFRNYGDIKKFIFSDRTQTNVSKIDKLKKIGQRFDLIFELNDISKEFYKQFKSKRDFIASNIENEIPNSQKYLLVQKIFDRIFFIYFLCHKKIISQDNGNEISGETLFQHLLKHGDTYEKLGILFDSFNNSDGSQVTLDDHKIFVPFLNGGLFKITDIEKKLTFAITSEDWQSIFNFLNRYNWIIDDDYENDIEENDASLTPEILGHVYERSVIEWEKEGFATEVENAIQGHGERKNKGVFYTPSYITRPICENTLYSYILSKFDNKYSTILELKKGSLEDIKKTIEVLNEVTILDPACGSGAFLVTVAELLFRLKSEFLRLNKDEIDNYKIKLDIITNSIFGVDVLRGAIELAKLRLWLWMVSSYKVKDEVQPLPNIEYNLRVGDSLVGWINESLIQSSLTRPINDVLNVAFEGLKVMFTTKKQNSELEKSKKLLEELDLERYLDAYTILINLHTNAHGKKADFLKQILEETRKSIYESINPAYYHNLNSKIKKNYSKKRPPLLKKDYDSLPPFHWRIDFVKIMRKGGFDIVIGNPPYVEVKKIEKWKKPVLQKQFTYLDEEIIKGRFDLFWGFLKQGVSLLRDNGFLGFLTEDSLLDSVSGNVLRKFLFTETTILGIKYTGKFPDAGVHTVITLLEKSPSDYKFEFENWENGERITLNKSFLLNQHNYIVNLNLTLQDNSNLKLDEKILNEIEEETNDLEHIIYLQQGMILQYGSAKTGKRKEEYVFKTKKRNFLPYIEGKNTARYFLPQKHSWLDYKPKEHHRPRMREVFENTKILVRRIATDSLIAVIDYGYFYTDNTLFTGTRWTDIKKFRHKYKTQITKVESKLSKTFDELSSISEKFEYEYLLAIINSRLLTYYYEKKFNTVSIDVLVKCKIKNTKKENQEIIGKISTIIQILNSNNEEKNYLDYHILDALIYEIYFPNSLKTNLIKKIKPHLKNLKKTKNESSFLIQCKKIYEKIKSDKNIDIEVKKIKENKIIKLIQSSTPEFIEL